MEPKTHAINIAPQLVVRDVVTSAEYYMQVLGFKLIGYFMEPPVYAMVVRDNCQLHFGKSDGEAIHLNRNIRRGTPDFVLWVPEIELFCAEVKSKGAKIIQEITQRSYGREFIVEDCDGRWVLVCD